MSLIGQTVGNYRITRLLGEGGMGVVYLGEHPVIGRKVAIKVLHISLSKDTEVVARFFNEARAIHTIGHENIVEILDFGQTSDGQPYFIMEYLIGEAINERIARGAIPANEVEQICDQVCRALTAAHDKGIVHRDLKPHNVQLLGTVNGRIQVKILDFGVAKVMNSGMGDGSQSVKTRTGSLMGTPLYMSPEQCKGSGKLDHRTDIYSLGVMIYEMLAGRPPFVAEGVGELFAMHMLQAPPQLADLAPEAPPVMVAAVLRSLAKNLEDRFLNMEEFRRALLGESTAHLPQSRADSGRGALGRSGMVSGFGGTMAFSTSKASTTLTSASRELDDDARPPRKSRSGLAIASVVLVAAGVAVFVLAGRKRTGGETAAGEGTVAQETTPGPSKRQVLPENVTLRFEASPPGVHVIRVTDGKDLGPVPMELKLPRDGGRPEYIFRLAGYQDKAVSADLTTDQTLQAALEKEKPAAPEPVKPEVKPARPVAAADDGADKPKKPKKPKKPVHGPTDEDGLATPSF